MDWKFVLTSFQGRINRAKFWAGSGIVAAILLVTLLLLMLSTVLVRDSNSDLVFLFFILVQLVLLASSVLAAWFALAVQVKRWHDRDKSGWWFLIGVIPIVGLWALIECGFLEGTSGANQYGSDPLAGTGRMAAAR